jgi:hypothetical protein
VLAYSTSTLFVGTMEDLPCASNGTELDLLKNSLSIKEHEVFYLRGELERCNHSHQLLLMSMERLEKTMAASYDRLNRKIDRLCHSVGGDESHKRVRRK